jgi:general L-amino acid transport system permease protein
MTLTSSNPVEQGAPLVARLGPVAWSRKNLFNSWFNSILTVVLVLVLGSACVNFLLWMFVQADWAIVINNFNQFISGLYKPELYWRIWTIFGMVMALSGLSWGLLARNQPRLLDRNVLIGLGAAAIAMVLLPLTRVNSPYLLGGLVLLVGLAIAGQAIGRKVPTAAQWITGGWFVSYFAALLLLGGGEVRASLLYGVVMIGGGILAGQQLAKRVSIPKLPGVLSDVGLFLLGFFAVYQLLWRLPYWLGLDFKLRVVSSGSWGGLTLTLLLAISGIVLCFPLGIILALGRRSKLPVFRGLSIAYIELIRGVPLISILFMGQVLIPLFLPEGVRPDRVVRAIIGLTIFSAAYLAENVRGGLQAVPLGQTEAAQSLGLSKPLTMALVVMPQALKTAIPAIVGQFISLFQDTTLLGIVGLVELLGITNNLLANPKYLGEYAQAYVFIAVLYWVFCYAMSYGSRKIEAALNTDQR